MKKPSWIEGLGRRLVLFGGILLLCNIAGATWSIVVVNTRTGEVCVASATCIAGADLKRFVPVVRTGVGGAAAQSFVNPTAANKIRIWGGFMEGRSPAQILANLAANDPSHQTRQYGIVNMKDLPVSFTGTVAGMARHDVSGVVGDLRYAVQGNVLTGMEVVLAAEAALIAAPGDLGQKVMAGMEAARALGGDGRCSCIGGPPTSCGVPPPSFTKSAHIGFIVLARVGDLDGTCNASLGCANGSYYLDLNVIGSVASPDPVLTLQHDYAAWRASQAARPDHILTRVDPGTTSLVADGRSRADVRIDLIDIEGQPLNVGGAQIQLTRVGSGSQVTQVGAIVDQGNGSYRVPIVAGLQPGQDTWRIVVDDGVGNPVTLYPDLLLRVDPAAELHAGRDALSAARGGRVPLTVNMGAANKGSKYLLLASASGTAPGIVFRGAALPLNPDSFLRKSLFAANTPELENSFGTLDLAGRGVAIYRPGPGDLTPWIGARIDWSALLLSPGRSASTAAGFAVLP